MGTRYSLALIADPHGNLLAMEAVLKVIQDAAPDRTVCAEDTATSTMCQMRSGSRPIYVFHGQ